MQNKGPLRMLSRRVLKRKEMPDLRVLVQNKFCILLGAFQLLRLTPICYPSVIWLGCLLKRPYLFLHQWALSHWSRFSIFFQLTSFLQPTQSPDGVVVIFCVCAWWVVFLGLVFKVLSLFPSKAGPQHGPLDCSVTGRRGKSTLCLQLWFQLWSGMVHGWLKSYVVPQGGWLLCCSGQDSSLTERCAKWGCRLWRFESLGKLTKGLQQPNQMCNLQCNKPSDRVDYFIYSYKAFFLEEKVMKSF